MSWIHAFQHAKDQVFHCFSCMNWPVRVQHVVSYASSRFHETDCMVFQAESEDEKTGSHRRISTEGE